MSHRLFVVTGASRGIGKAVTKALASSSVFSDGKMHFVLTSTKQMDLDAAKASLEETVTKLYGNIDRLSVYLYPIDFSDMDNIESQLGHLFDLAPTPTSKWTQVVLMMNHGSLGGLDFIEDVSSKLSQLQTAINVNITSCIMFSSIALKKFAGISERLDLVNISSLAAIQPFESWGVYCIGKAARDMLIQIVAKEVESVASLSRGTSIKALNYAPGPVDTDMQAEIRSTASVPEQKALYTSLFNEGKLVTADGTTAKLVGILEKNDYKCGAHVDYFDE